MEPVMTVWAVTSHVSGGGALKIETPALSSLKLLTITATGQDPGSLGPSEHRNLATNKYGKILMNLYSI
jgi:hypothetical protein